MKSKIFYFVAFSILFSSCTKEGPVGPAGPQGNANVHALTFAISPNQWYHIGTQGMAGDGYEFIVAAPNITADVVSTGSVIAYLSFDNVGWFAIPYTVPLYSGHAYSESWLPGYSVGQLSIDIADNDFQTQPPVGTVYIKIVAVAGSIRIRNPKVDWKNYEEVKNEFNLND